MPLAARQNRESADRTGHARGGSYEPPPPAIKESKVQLSAWGKEAGESETLQDWI